MTVSPWPPSVHVRRVLRRARRRLHATRPESRPSLRDPRSYVGLLAPRDLLTLSRWSYWPLPPRALAWLAEPPATRARRRQRADRRIEAVARRFLARELPEAVALLTGRGAR
jgi:hypothetical protein